MDIRTLISTDVLETDSRKSVYLLHFAKIKVAQATFLFVRSNRPTLHRL